MQIPECNIKYRKCPKWIYEPNGMLADRICYEILQEKLAKNWKQPTVASRARVCVC